jgi:hypothetical protein
VKSVDSRAHSFAAGQQQLSTNTPCSSFHEACRPTACTQNIHHVCMCVAYDLSTCLLRTCVTTRRKQLEPSPASRVTLWLLVAAGAVLSTLCANVRSHTHRSPVRCTQTASPACHIKSAPLRNPCQEYCIVLTWKTDRPSKKGKQNVQSSADSRQTLHQTQRRHRHTERRALESHIWALQLSRQCSAALQLSVRCLAHCALLQRQAAACAQALIALSPLQPQILSTTFSRASYQPYAYSHAQSLAALQAARWPQHASLYVRVPGRCRLSVRQEADPHTRHWCESGQHKKQPRCKPGRLLGEWPTQETATLPT